MSDTLLKAASSLHDHFKKAAAHHMAKANMHQSKADMHTAKAAHHAAKMDAGLDEMKDIHKSLHEAHKFSADHHTAMCKDSKDMHDHCNDMADKCYGMKADAEAEIAKAAVKPAVEADKTEKTAAPVAETKPAEAAPAVPAEKTAAADGLNAAIKSIQDMVAGIDAKIEAAVNKALETKVAPAPAVTMVPRTPVEKKDTPGVYGYNDTGL